jgi:hypothetical protein
MRRIGLSRGERGRPQGSFYRGWGWIYGRDAMIVQADAALRR